MEDTAGFCKTFKKVYKKLGFHLKFKINDLQNIIFTSMSDDKDVAIVNLYLYLPNLIPSVETQVMFNEATKNKLKISFGEYYTERRVISDMITQADIGIAQQVNNLKYLIGVHQTRTRRDTADKNNNIAIFDNIDLRKHYVEIVSLRYPRDNVLMNYEQNEYIEK